MWSQCIVHLEMLQSSVRVKQSVNFWHQKCEIWLQAQLESKRGVNYLFVTDPSQRLAALCWCWYREISVIESHVLITNTCMLFPISFHLFYLTQGHSLCFQGCSVNVTYLAGALNTTECEQHPLIWGDVPQKVTQSASCLIVLNVISFNSSL